MSSDVVLSAALRNNLLSLQNTQKGIDSTQLRLSTGKKVNSALDNPQSFFASQALTNRASDLTKLLDSIGQSIEVIKAADNGVTALTSLINSAQAVAQSAQTAIASANTGTAKIVGNVDLSKLTTIVGVGGTTGTGNDSFLVTSYDSSGNVVNTATIAIAAGDTAAQFANKITASAVGTGAAAVTGSLDANGYLNIEAKTTGYTFRIDTIKNNNVTTVAAQQNFVNGLGLANYFSTEELSGGATQQIAATVNNSNSITSHALTSGGNTATLNSLISSLTGVAAFTVNTSDDVFTIKAGGQTLNFAANGATVGDLINQVNNGTLAGLVSASFDSVSGKITLSAASPSVGSIQLINNTSAAGGAVFSFGFGANKSGVGGPPVDSVSENIDFSGNLASGSQITSLQTQYNGIRAQIDALVTNGDTAYQGVNLLNGDNLVTTFNEGRTSTLTTAGSKFTSTGLGITAANFSSATNVNAALTQISTALTTVRNFGSSLASNLSVIQTRQTFANSLITTLNEGSDALVNADQNEEGAKLLALQTRQSLGVTALSLASQSQQSILRLFQ